VNARPVFALWIVLGLLLAACANAPEAIEQAAPTQTLVAVSNDDIVQADEPTPVITESEDNTAEETVLEPTEAVDAEPSQVPATAVPASSSSGGASQLPVEQDDAGPQFEDSGLYAASDTTQIAATGKYQFLNFYADW
jgi:hypothetical protein